MRQDAEFMAGWLAGFAGLAVADEEGLGVRQPPAKTAAVLVAVHWQDGEWRILLTRRTPHLRSHAFREPSIHLRARDLCGMDARSPTLKLLGELTRAGYDVEACKVEVLAMRHHLEGYADLCRLVQTASDSSQHAAVTVRLN